MILLKRDLVSAICNVISNDVHNSENFFLDTLYNVKSQDLKLLLELMVTVTGQEIEVCSANVSIDKSIIVKPRSKINDNSRADSDFLVSEFKHVCSDISFKLDDGDFESLARCSLRDLKAVLDFIKIHL